MNTCLSETALYGESRVAATPLTRDSRGSRKPSMQYHLSYFASKADEKSNLYVFITPHVIENPAEAEEIYNHKKDDVDKIKEGNIKMYEWGWDKFDTPE